MTLTTRRKCRWCGGLFAAADGPGRPRLYCKRSHRQRAFEARRLSEVHQLGPDDVLLTRSSFEGIRDLMYRIESALQDVDMDLRTGAEPGEYRKALWHLYGAAGDVRSVSFEPKAIGYPPG